MGAPTRRLLSGWGRTAPTAAEIRAVHSLDELADAVVNAPPRGLIARGLGRSYNDAAQDAGGLVLDLTALDGEVTVDTDGTVTCAAGVSLGRLLRELAPLGRTLPVVPGTASVTVGGALAADVHGKDHHVVGSFADHVRRLQLVTADGEVREVERGTELFAATAGGMGLTGIVAELSFDAPAAESAWVAVDTDRADGLDGVLAALADGPSTHPFEVAWLDAVVDGAALGRGIVTRARPATAAEVIATGTSADPTAVPAARAVPAPARVPRGLLNVASIRGFNELRFRRAPVRARGDLQHLTSFLHPLDAISGWNRLHGPDGFLQHQSVVPLAAADTLRATLRRLRDDGLPVALAVLKRLGPGNDGLLSFPAEGWTLALDLPNRRGVRDTLDAIDEQIVAAGGRIYLAKDARVDPRHLPAMYPGVDRFRQLRRELDPTGRVTSDLARRLGL